MFYCKHSRSITLLFPLTTVSTESQLCTHSPGVTILAQPALYSPVSTHDDVAPNHLVPSIDISLATSLTYSSHNVGMHPYHVTYRHFVAICTLKLTLSL